MLGNEDGAALPGSRGKNSGVWVLLALLMAKAARASGLFAAFEWLHIMPVSLYCFFVLGGSSVFFLIFQRPWHGRRSITSKQWMRIGFYSFIILLQTMLWNVGLKYYGPIRTILSADYSDLMVYHIMGAVLGRKSLGAGKLQGAIAAGVGYLVLYLFGVSITPKYAALDMDATFAIGPFGVSNERIGGICLGLAVGLTILSKNIARRLCGDIGGTKRLHALSTTTASLMLLPFALYYMIFGVGKYANSTVAFELSLSTLLSLFTISLFVYVVDYYVETIAFQQLDVSAVAKVSLTSSFLMCFFVALLWNYTAPLSIVKILAFALIIFGVHNLLGTGPGVSAMSMLPTFTGSDMALSPRTGGGGGGGANMSIGLFMRSAVRQIIANPTSRRIFGFLLVNLCFMFVELVYGVWTNSLGLITDAAHMLFDCTALFIGLVAEVISRWDKNQVFSYGYGRVSVLSGFVNGIFLVFIAFFVFMESIERFMEPPEVKTDRLLLVSCLGFLVNIVGVVAFHDHGGHGHSHGGGDHGHSHGGGHAHSHGGHDDHAQEGKAAKRSENMDGVFLHLLADTLGSVGVIISSFIIQTWGYTLADPICSFCISILIFLSVIPLIKSSTRTLLQSTPRDLLDEMDDIEQHVRRLEGVLGVRDLHFWAHTQEHIIGTVHVQVARHVEEQKILTLVQGILKDKGVTQATVEIEKQGEGQMGADSNNIPMFAS